MTPAAVTRARTSVAALALLAALSACGGDPAQAEGPKGPPLPPLTLKPLVPTLEELAARLADPDEDTRRTLTDYGDIALQRVEADGRTAALSQRALLEHPDAWWVLEPALADEAVGIRRRAAWLCGESGQTVLQLPLVHRLKYELDPETVLWVADALARLGNDGALSWLDAAIDHEATAQQAGAMAITALRARRVELPEEPTWDQLRQALRVVADNWRETGRTLLQDVAAPDPKQLESRLARRLLTPNGWQLRPVDDARFVVRNCGRLTVPMLARTIHAEEHYIRTMPLQELARLGHAAREAKDAVLPLLGDPLTAAYAVRTLGEIGATDALPHLRPLLETPETELRAAATQALGLLEDDQSRPALEARMADEEEVLDVRVGAAFGLLCMGEHAAAEQYLAEREKKGDYHEATLTQLRERLAARRRDG